MILFFYLLTALFWDLRTYRIPNWWIIVGIILGSVDIMMQGSLLGVAKGGLVVSVLLPLFFLGGLGGGDIKIFYVCAMFLESSVSRLILLSFFLNGIYALIQVLYQKELFQRLMCLYQYCTQCFYTGKIYPYQSLDGSVSRNQLHFMIGIFLAYLWLNREVLWKVLLLGS